ncbi:MFS family permease [Altererythrobacter atlanticus]|uniref:Proline/betaine transporter n=1 Tax=Croceibacterium atlanticum TaxID=1267766 RepID=A0A0F7KR65_9SPHN|nr:MFS transporter [Croceibacterium atlanticum]AKH41586.1 Proline/betaine transporter [Croceibacterium atlanticum]MBB5733048.1 MFS family permease [Croceibacterium atlanticum]
MASGAATSAHHQPDAKEMRLVIAASSAGTVFEWYDFFIYGTLAPLIAAAFFPSDNSTLSLLLTWAGFAIGFGFRPLGAILFGFLGDRLGRKYTFLVTVTLMGIATAGVGLIPSAETIGLAAPLIVILLRILQGLALGGEYGGAAIYVSEHSPPDRRGYFTGFIQASVVGGFVLSLVVVLACRFLIPADIFESWAWRLPFLLSIVLLAISLWMRMRLSESPVFKAMKEEGATSSNPFVESFTYPGNKKRIFIALFGVACGLTIVFYTALFSSLSFLKGPMRVEDTLAELLIGLACLMGLFFFVYFGSLSDRIGRKKPIVWGYIASLLLLFPCFWGIAALANPQLSAAAEQAPVVITGPDCEYDPFAENQSTACGKLMSEFSGLGIPYTVSSDEEVTVRFGAEVKRISDSSSVDRATVETWLSQAGYDLSDQIPPAANIVGIVALLIVLSALSGATYGPVASLLSEMFPARIRYSSMSIPYHIGAGYFGGFLPLISGYIVARTGDIFAGLWYTWILLIVALAVALWGLPSGPPRDFADDPS